MRRTTRIAAGGLVLLSLAACGQAEDSGAKATKDPKKETLTIGVANLGLSFPFPASIGEGIKAKGKDLGVKVVQLDAKGKAETQSNTVRDLISQKVDGVLLLPVDSGASTSLVDQLKAADIPVVAVASQVGDPKTRPLDKIYEGLVALATQNEVKAGRAAGELALKSLPKGGKVAIVEGSAGFAEVKTRSAEFFDPAKKANVKFTVVAKQPGDWLSDKARSACQNMLSSNPDIDLFYAQSDDMAAGCGQAVKAAGSDAKVIGIGGSKLGVDGVRDGTIDGTVCYKPRDLGELAMKTLYDNVTGKSSETEQFVTYDTPAVTKANLDACKPQW